MKESLDLSLLLLALGAYVAGSIPSGYLICKVLLGIDIRTLGSGNPGTANVYRSVGPRAGLGTLVLDVAKGAIPVVLTKHFVTQDVSVLLVCGVAAIAGHFWMVFLRFKGGKGVATSAGVFLVLMPKPLAVALGAFLVLTFGTGHISAGSIAGAAVLPAAAFALGADPRVAWVSLAVCAVILYKHLPNLKRLLASRELPARTGDEKG